MKKPKVSLDGAKIQGLIVQHVEKALLVIVALVSVFLVYQGFSLPRLDSSQSPKGLLEASQSVKTYIDDPQRWEKEVKQTRVINMPIAEKVDEFQADTDPSAYFLANAWSKPSFPKLSPRKDPTPFPPMHLKTVAVVGPLALVKLGEEADPLQPIPSEEDDDASPKPKAKPKPKPKAKPKTGGLLDPMGMAGVDPMGTGGSQKKSKRKARGSGEGVGDAHFLEDGDPMGMGMMGMPGETGNFGGAGGAIGAINPESIFGYQATSQTAKAVPAQAIVVMGVVPFEKQLEDFQAALAESLDYDPVRDTPLYLQFHVERADVTADPAADPATLTWTRLGTNAALDEARTTWAGGLGEIVDPRYLDPPPAGRLGGLTHPAPPFMQRESWELLTHPDVPLAAVATSESESGGARPGATRPKSPRAISDDPVFGPAPGGSGAGSGGMASGMPMPGGMPAAMPGMGDAGMGAAGMGGSGGMYGSGGAMVAPPKYKLIRFTDTTPEAGHKYRYRFKVFLHDPNNPATGYTPPSPPSLAPEVQERLKKTDPKIHYVESAWSEPSPVAELPDTSRYFAGAVSVAKPSIINNASVPLTQPVAKALSVVWDPTKVVDVPGEADVYRGSVLNYTVTTKVVHPVNHIPVDLEDYRVTTGAMVADILGGEDIPMIDKRNDKEPLKSPGELLIFDSAGNLHVRNETDDIEGYRRYVLPESPETGGAAPAGNDPMAPGMAMPGGDILGMPMPGASGPSKRRTP